MARRDKELRKLLTGGTVKGTDIRSVAHMFGWYKDPKQNNATSHINYIHDVHSEKVTILARDYSPNEVRKKLKELKLI